MSRTSAPGDHHDERPGDLRGLQHDVRGGSALLALFGALSGTMANRAVDSPAPPGLRLPCTALVGLAAGRAQGGVATLVVGFSLVVISTRTQRVDRILRRMAHIGSSASELAETGRRLGTARVGDGGMPHQRSVRREETW